MKKFDNVNLKVARVDAEATIALLIIAGLQGLADQLLAKTAEKENGPRLVRVRNDADRNVIDEILSERVETQDLQPGDSIVAQNQIRFQVESVDGLTVNLTKTVEREGRKSVTYKKVMAGEKFTRLIEDTVPAVEKVEEPVVEEVAAAPVESAKDKKNRIRREKRAAKKAAEKAEKAA